MTRPTFAAVWSASLRIYDPSNPAEKVAQVIGGKVAAHIHDKKHPWKNTCAVRMSYILNQSGVVIPVLPATEKGGSNQNYFYRVKDVISFLT